ncbi:hypothetical protein BGZ99_008480 [Dissophora globulifera]|uniref:Uncharacterized protein n=1 Tax=Dissophora globulifera TaxID=979702 RepID=A0A9P6RTV3_9FUNG|nr:hypothetical protein BGZ99_008480 [Dissophora globulifera]
MIIYAHVAVASVTISIIKIVLSGTIGAIVGFYVKYGRDEYSNSIRWSRIGGFFEMVTLCRNSFGQLSTRSRAVMILMISASVSTLFVTILLGASVSRTRSPTKPAKKSVFTQQPVSTNSIQWTDWIAYMEADATMEGTMSSLLNGTIYNPSPSPWTIYTPPRYTYNVPCTETGVAISKNSSEIQFGYPSPHDNCKLVFLRIESGVYIWDDKRASDQLISPGLHMMVGPITFLGEHFLEIEHVFYAYNGKVCILKSQTIATFRAFPNDGLTSLPRTDSTRCQFGSNDSFVVTATLIKFAINHLSDFDKVAFMIFDDPSNLPLLKAMRTAINNGTFASPTNNSTMVLLTNMSDNVDFLVCASRFLGQPNDMGLICTYMVTATITTAPQSWDPSITADLNWNSTLPADPGSVINQNDISVYHMPPLGSGDSMTTYSAAHLLEATPNMTEYFASLGHNVILNNETGRFYVLYDTVELTQAFEVSTTLLIFVGCIVGICCIIWGFSEKFYPAVFNGSLYKLIYTEIKLKENTPMLMSFKQDPLAFNGYQVIPDLDEQPCAPSREVPVLVVNIESTQQLLVQEIPMQQLSARQLPMESEILVQNQSLTAKTCSPTTTVAPVATDTDNSASTTNLMSFPVRTSSMPTMPLFILPRSLESHRNYTRVSTIQPSPPLHTTSNSIQDVPSSASTNQESSLI